MADGSTGWYAFAQLTLLGKINLYKKCIKSGAFKNAIDFNKWIDLIIPNIRNGDWPMATGVYYEQTGTYAYSGDTNQYDEYSI